MITIVVSLRGRVITAQAFEQERIRIGRAPENELRIDNPALSRFHAAIERSGRVYTLVDHSERNGVYLNGERVERRHLNHGDTIALGKFVLTIDLTGRLPAPRSRPVSGDRTLELAPPPTRPAARVPGIVALAHLEVVDGEPVVLDQDACVVGSAADCHLRPRGLLVPGRLALVIRGHGGFSLLNLGPPRRVRLAGAPVEGRVWLRDGDALAFCGLQARFVHGLPVAAATAGGAA